MVVGFIDHTYHLLAGGLQALENDNEVVWSLCVRGLIETFGACVMISDRPETITNHLENVKAGKLYNAAKRAKPEFARDLDRLHKRVHPAPGAIYSHVMVVDETERRVILGFGLRQPDAHNGREGVTVLANLADLVAGSLCQLAANQRALSAGNVVMIRE